MVIFRLRKALMLLLSVALVLSGGLSFAHAQDTVELKVWDQFTGETDSAAADAIYKSFMDANPNVKIVREVVQTEQMRQTVNTAIASGTGPDIIFYDAGPGYAGVLADAGLLEPLDPYAKQYGWHDRVAPQSMEATTIGGHLYGMPLQVDLIGMFYNKTLMDKEGWTPPTSIEELKTLCKNASDKGYVPMAFTNNPGWQGFHQFSMVTNNMLGPDAVNGLLRNNEGSWNSPEVVKGLNTYFVELRDAGCYSEDVNALTNDDGAAMFQSGQSIMYPTGSWMVNEFTPETMPDMEITMQPFPPLDGGKGSYWVSGVGSAYYIAKSSKNKDAAAQFIDYLFQPDAAKKWVQDAGFFIPLKVDTEGLEISPLASSVLGVFDEASAGKVQFGYNIDVAAPARFNDTLLNGMQKIIAGDQTPEQLAVELQAAWEQSKVATPVATPVEATPGS